MMAIIIVSSIKRAGRYVLRRNDGLVRIIVGDSGVSLRDRPVDREKARNLLNDDRRRLVVAGEHVVCR